jgi:hypothetical protein
MRKPIVNAAVSAARGARVPSPLPPWPWEPRRSELMERVAPPLLKLLCWALAAVIALPLLLSLLAPFLA